MGNKQWDPLICHVSLASSGPRVFLRNSERSCRLTILSVRMSKHIAHASAPSAAH